MNLLLIALSLISIAAALACGAVAWRLVREERRRSEARVAALAAAIAADEVRTPSTAPTPVAHLFDPPGPSSGLPLLKFALPVVLGAVVLGGLAITQTTGGSPDTAVHAGSRRVLPLELVSLHHAREGDALTVTGLVRNPPAGTEVARVTVMVFAFDRAGRYVASGRAPLDFLTLAPGDESPFVVKIPGAGGVGRYRVSFRTEGGVVRHVDRRGDGRRLSAARHIPGS